jgi:hypothetical protein
MKHPFFIAAALMLAVAPARGQDRVSEAREHFDKGLAAFALGHYSDAADEYEKAFELKTDSALLYNAAQAHRLAGHYERALKLYQSYQRIFGKRVKNGPKVQQHIDELTKLLAAQAKEKDRPPVDVIAPTPASQPESATAATGTSATAPDPASVEGKAQPNGARPDLVQAHPERKPLVKRPWLWVGVGGAVVAVGLGVGLGVGLSRAPSPSFGATTVQ